MSRCCDNFTCPKCAPWGPTLTARQIDDLLKEPDMNTADVKAWDANRANTIEQQRMDTGKAIDKGKIDPEARGSSRCPSPRANAKRRPRRRTAQNA